MKILFTYSIILILSGCSNIGLKLSNMSKNSCTFKMNDVKFDELVSDSYSNQAIKNTMAYEHSYNSMARNEIAELLNIIRAKPLLSEAEQKEAILEITRKMNSEVIKIKNLAKYIEKNQNFYKDENLSDIFTNYIPIDIESGIKILRSNADKLLKGEVPNLELLSEGKVYFCSDSKEQIIMGKRSVSGLVHALHHIISYIYKKPAYKMKISSDNYEKNSVLMTVLPLPSKFMVSDEYNEIKTSEYFYNQSSRGIIILSVGNNYINIFSKGKDPSKDRPQYFPWYVNALGVNKDITEDFMLYAHRLSNKNGYIPASFIDSIDLYQDFIEQFKPINIKNYKKDLKPGQLILIRSFAKHATNNVDSIVKGVDSLSGLLMDYDQKNDMITIFTEYTHEDISKVGLGYETISLKSQLIDHQIFAFKPIDITPEQKQPDQGVHNATEVNKLEVAIEEKLESTKEVIKNQDNQTQNNNKANNLLLKKY